MFKNINWIAVIIAVVLFWKCWASSGMGRCS